MAQFDDKGILFICSSCGQKNRIPFSYLGQSGRCGACRASLPPPTHPLAIDQDAHFAELIANCPVPVLVDYWAPWCAPCRAVAPELEKVAAAEAGNLIVVKVNTEELPTLAQRFGIHSIPTMAIFSHGRETNRTAGARPAAAIQAFIRQAVSQSG